MKRMLAGPEVALISNLHKCSTILCFHRLCDYKVAKYILHFLVIFCWPT